jgi:hypothetical protein
MCDHEVAENCMIRFERKILVILIGIVIVFVFRCAVLNWRVEFQCDLALFFSVFFCFLLFRQNFFLECGRNELAPPASARGGQRNRTKRIVARNIASTRTAHTTSVVDAIESVGVGARVQRRRERVGNGNSNDNNNNNDNDNDKLIAKYHARVVAVETASASVERTTTVDYQSDVDDQQQFDQCQYALVAFIAGAFHRRRRGEPRQQRRRALVVLVQCQYSSFV